MEEDRFIEYRKYLADTEKADSTVIFYLREAEAFVRYFGKDIVTKDDALEYKKHLQTVYTKSATINFKITAVNVYLRYIGLENCTVKTVKMQARQCPENVLTKEEYKIMLEYSKTSGREKYYLIMRTLALTGCRISELKGLTVQALSTGTYQTQNKGKIREIYLPDKLVEELQAYCRKEKIENGYIFIGRNGKPITRSGIYRMLQKLADITGVSKEKAHPHSFRHLFALTYIDTYNNIGELADILGHSSLEITRIYLSSSREQKRRKMNKLDL